jgi:hypothetical protein
MRHAGGAEATGALRWRTGLTTIPVVQSALVLNPSALYACAAQLAPLPTGHPSVHRRVVRWRRVVADRFARPDAVKRERSHHALPASVHTCRRRHGHAGSRSHQSLSGGHAQALSPSQATRLEVPRWRKHQRSQRNHPCARQRASKTQHGVCIRPPPLRRSRLGAGHTRRGLDGLRSHGLSSRVEPAVSIAPGLDDQKLRAGLVVCALPPDWTVPVTPSTRQWRSRRLALMDDSSACVRDCTPMAKR